MYYYYYFVPVGCAVDHRDFPFKWIQFEKEGENEMYEIRLALEADWNALIQFIDQYWKKDHIFVSCNELLDWQHLDKKRERYNFVIGIEKKSQAIHGVLGFIPLSQFDPEIELGRLCWMAIWKVKEAARGHKLGRRLLSYLEDTIKPDILSTVAASSMTLSMYKARGYKVGRLNHHFILNPEKSDYNLVNANVSGLFPVATGILDADKSLEQSSENDISNGTANCFLLQKDLPRKSVSYLINRYFKHPIYSYQLYRIQKRMKTLGIIVTRVCSHRGNKAIRIVDFIGPSDALHGLRDQWMHLIESYNAEYLDFYSAGIDEDDLMMSGFVRCESGGDIVIPNYFEPFTKENVEIDYMISIPAGQTYRIVKGDSDQDRPNLVKGMVL